ncbi:DUF1361 domain-containing protein [Bernardetia sp.]|uniref:DUF1361 domain-containing protein n=1 Tax=Bernardetia sp. TaxID=1937974 RepID=UPI0025B84277|nr:DUF1361 domain-containing protein [Bernardetia sp.]
MASNKKKYLTTLLISTILSVGILFVRNLVENNSNYNFLLWNLFLGFIPFGVVLLIDIFYQKLNTILIVLGVCLWLLFYPNAPYMISDLIHVDKNSSVVLYDTLIIFSLSILSLFYGFYSLKLVYEILVKWKSKKIANFLISFCIVLSSFGIYLGRILRLNSWDVFTKPIQTAITIFEHLFPVTKNPVTYLVIFLFSFVQFMVWFLIKDFKYVE